MSAEQEMQQQQPAQETGNKLEQQQAPPEVEAAAKTTTNEPVESGAAGDATELRSLGSTLFTAIAFAAFVLLVVATPISWMSRRQIAATTHVSLWKTTTVNVVAGTTTTTNAGSYSCTLQTKRFRAIGAFAVIAVILGAASVVAGVAARVSGRGLKIGAGLGAATAVAALIAWAMAVRQFYQSGSDNCGVASYNELKYDMDAGIGLFIGGSVLAAIGAAVAVRDPKVPAVLPEALVDAALLRVHAFLMFVSFAFVTIGAPTPLVSVWLSETVYMRIVRGHEERWVGDAKTLDVALWDANCGERDKLVKVVLAFAIISIFTALFAFLVALVALRGKAGRGPVFMSSALATLTLVVTVGSALTVYYRRFCADPTLDYTKFTVAYGGSLIVASMVIAFFVTFVLGAVLVGRAVSATGGAGNTRWTAVLFIVALLIAILFQAIGAGTPLFGISPAAQTATQYTFWEKYGETPATGFTEAFGCPQLAKRLNGGGALNIIAILLAFAALVLGALQLTAGGLRRVASFVALGAALMLLVSWALAVDVYTGGYCGNEFQYNGYSISAGLGLLIAAWCVIVVAAVLNLLVGPAEETA